MKKGILKRLSCLTFENENGIYGLKAGNINNQISGKGGVKMEEKSIKKEAITAGEYTRKVFEKVKLIFTLFFIGEGKRAVEKFRELRKFVETANVYISEFGEDPQDYIEEYRGFVSVIAMNGEALKDIEEKIDLYLSKDCCDKRDYAIMIQHLWRLCEGWNWFRTRELIFAKFGIEAKIVYEIPARAREKAKQIIEKHLD